MYLLPSQMKFENSSALPRKIVAQMLIIKYVSFWLRGWVQREITDVWRGKVFISCVKGSSVNLLYVWYHAAVDALLCIMVSS